MTFAEWYDAYLAELATHDIPVPTVEQLFCTAYLACNVAAWRDRDEKRGRHGERD